MSFKNKIYGVVVLLIVLTVFIAGSGMYSMSKIQTNMREALTLSENVSELKDVKSKMQDVLIGVREIVLQPAHGGVAGEKENIDKAVASIDASLRTLKVEEKSAASWAALRNEWNKHKEIVGRIYEADLAGNRDESFNILMTECNPTRVEESRLIAEVVADEEAGSRAAVAQADADYTRSWWVLLGTSVVATILGIVLSGVMVSRLSRALSTSITQLRERSDDVNRIAAQMASGASELAEGATEQASSLEETSSALEEMASVTRQNAENAGTTKTTTDHNLEVIGKGSQTVQKVIGAMDEISESSTKISDIIDTIESIAFQTNLLALNAAVEAARAGEAGKGFAVVADEVRNLASRSTQAARSTSELIQGTVERVRHGSDQVRELADNFHEIESESRNVGGLVGGISAATNEQAMGVDQINIAVAQMDKVTQSNAATAEETAAAANDLSEQSSHLNELVSDLAALVYGSGKSSVMNRVRQRIRSGVTKTIHRVKTMRESRLPLPAPDSQF